jgi:octaprenyl-diphosphate synthase
LAVAAGAGKSPDRTDPKHGIAPLQELCADDMRRVNEEILARMDSRIPLIPEVASHIVAAGGKRLRPLLTLASARMCGYQDGARHIGLAAAVEFIHTATLLHDDVVDESALRRGKASANEVFGNQSSVLVGDFLFARAFELMVESGSLEVLRILSHASAVITEGEVLQLAAANDVSTTEETYLKIIGAKTAALFAAACRTGAVVAEAGSEAEEALETYGWHLGLAFQVVDDVLDYSAAQARLGKTVGDDFAEGKITLPVVLAIARGADDADQQAFWKRTLEQVDQHDGDLAHAMSLMGRHRALDDAIAGARDHAATAKAALAALPAGPIRDALADTADFCVDRDY